MEEALTFRTKCPRCKTPYSLFANVSGSVYCSRCGYKTEVVKGIDSRGKTIDTLPPYMASIKATAVESRTRFQQINDIKKAD